MPHAQNTLTKAEFEAGLKGLEERLTQRFERLLLLQQTFTELDRIKETANVNPKSYTEEDVPRLVKEVRGEPKLAEHHTQQILALREKDAALDARVDNFVSAIGEPIRRPPPPQL